MSISVLPFPQDGWRSDHYAGEGLYGDHGKVEYGQYGSTGGSGDDGGDWESYGKVTLAVAFAMLLANCEKATDVYGKILGRQNDATELILNKMDKISNAKAELVKLLAEFPVPKDEKDQNPALSDLGDKVDPETVASLNRFLSLLNMSPISMSSKKSDLESLQTRLTGENETQSGKQGMQSTKTNFYLGKLTANETMSTNVVKAQSSMEMSVARNSGTL
jgi:hypothetical protein